MQEGAGLPDEPPEAVGAADQAAQHVAAPLVGGQDAVGDHEGHGTAVVGDDAQGGVRLVVGAVGHPGNAAGVLDDGLEQVGVEVRIHALAHGGDAFQPHARVDGGLGQRGAGAVGGLVVLHEHQVPDFQVAVAVALADAAVRPAGHVLALVDEDFRARAAGAGIAHGPEVVLLSHAVDAFRRDVGVRQPQVARLVVVTENGGIQAFLGQLQVFGQELPGELDGVFLEIVAEREVAQHFEKGVVARGAAHVFEVVVLAAHAQALLRGGGPHVAALFLPQENLLELLHPRVGEQQRGVVLGHEGRRAHDLVALRLEEFKEPAPDFVGGYHWVSPVRIVWRRRRTAPRTSPCPQGGAGGGATHGAARIRRRPWPRRCRPGPRPWWASCQGAR
ncbi:hypothetical protein DSECCO2_557960 [anaerobic digester metagenome]